MKKKRRKKTCITFPVRSFQNNEPKYPRKQKEKERNEGRKDERKKQ